MWERFRKTKTFHSNLMINLRNTCGKKSIKRMLALCAGVKIKNYIRRMIEKSYKDDRHEKRNPKLTKKVKDTLCSTLEKQ
jgi:hypothetical protein